MICSPRASFLTAQTIMVDGGLTLTDPLARWTPASANTRRVLVKHAEVQGPLGRAAQRRFL